VTEVWRIPYVNPGAQFVEEKAELMPRIEAVLAGGMHVGGPEIEGLEHGCAHIRNDRRRYRAGG
jgi:hypothetical protein